MHSHDLAFAPQVAVAPSELDPLLTWRTFELRTRSRRIWRSGTPLALSEREFDLFATLVREPRRVFHKQRLFELVWGRNSRATSNVVEVYVSYLRVKIDRAGEPSFIRTVRSVGYGLR
ncbi:MAG: winged helix-turn-helix domain-containing protein [Candidatus Eremiobacteraeota bacterium]|nr:winged helix-turn-helix domain-containing protein [Candidatus Eremiobacteraeota bacterium]